MRALITGSSGFIGNHMTSVLAAAGYDVTTVDRSDPHHPVDARVFFRRDEAYYDVAVHCAANVGGRRVVIRSPLDHAENLETDAALFAWARRTQPGRVVYFSSSCAYPEIVPMFIPEDAISWPPGEEMMPDKLYGWTKLTGELVANTARDAGIPVSIVRPFSVYGPGMADGFAVKGFADQIKQRADPIEIWGSADQVRDFIHVDDVCRAVMLMISKGIDGPVNLGTGRGVSLPLLAEIMAHTAGYSPDIKVNPGMPAGVPRLVADPRRLHEFYTPVVELEDGVRKLV